jgi:arylsulfatase A-like enzyme
MGWPFPADQDMVPPWKYDSSGAQSTPLPPVDDALRAKWREAFSRPVFGGPRAAGFDYYFGVDVPNWPPYCFIENDTPTGIPSGWLPLGMLGNNQGSLQGPAMEGWNFEQLLPTFAAKADEFIRQCSAGGDARPDGDARADGNVRADGSVPFFLYLPMTSPHTPLAVNAPFKGASGLNNLYADLVIETDDIFGRIMASLRKYGLEDNTLVCFASDNGCAHYIGAKELEAQGHFPSGAYRGYKSDAWDGGHRIPFIVKWPGRIRPGSRSGALVCLSDLFATCVDILGEGAAAAGAGAAGPAHGTAAGITAGGPVVSEDSVSLLPLFKFSGAAAQVRDCVVHHSIAGKFAIRDRQWKLVLCPGSGGWTKNDAEAFKEGLPLAQLYDMDADPGEARNLAKEQPDRVRAMVRRLQSIVDDGRSTPGPQSANDVPVDIWKLDTLPGADASILDDY